MSRLTTLALFALVLAGLGLYVVNEKPQLYERVRYPLRYEQIVKGHARNYDLEPHLVAAVIYQESKFDADAVSRLGCGRPDAALPATAQGIADRTGGSGWQERGPARPRAERALRLVVPAPPARQVQGRGARFAAYNAGQTNVDRWRARGVGIQFAETRHYVERVQQLKRVYARAYADELGL